MSPHCAEVRAAQRVLSTARCATERASRLLSAAALAAELHEDRDSLEQHPQDQRQQQRADADEQPVLLGEESPERSSERRKFPALAKLPRKRKRYVYPPEFDGAFSALPARHAAHPKADAYRAWRSAVKFADEPFQLEAAALAYADEQNALFDTGMSKVRWPDSKHNINRDGENEPGSLAIDVAPFPIDWDNRAGFLFMAGLITQSATENGVIIRYGGDWDMDDILVKDQSFQDLGHFEIVG